MTEETSLARQLKKLAAPQTSLLSQDKIRSSLLFDPKEASGVDRDTFFHFGLTGFDKLLLVNKVFEKFEETLFSDSAKTFERSIQSENVNKKLDEKLNSFLTALSPYVLLRCAHEALEWLIYRFHIHMFNVDALISCVLPYYHTRIFIRIIQLIDTNDKSDQWYWLQSTKKSGEPLRLNILLRRFNSDLWFRKFVCNLVPKIIHEYKSDKESCLPVISFATTVTYYSIKHSSEVSESQIAFLLPYINNGLKSDVPSLCSGVYSIISTLVSKAKLSSSLLDELLIRISEHLMPLITKHGIELLVLICELQNIGKLPKKVFIQLCVKNNEMSSLYDLVKDYGNTKFVKLLIKKSINLLFKHVPSKLDSKHINFEFLLILFESLDLDLLLVKLCFNNVMKRYTQYHGIHKKKKASLSMLKRVAKSLLVFLETHQPEHFDNAIESYFKKATGKPEKVALDLLTTSISSIEHKILPDSGIPLLLGINHANDVIREHAVKVLIKYARSKKVKDLEFIHTGLLNCILDSNLDIVMLVLLEGQVLIKVIQSDLLLSTLVSFLRRKGDRESSKLRKTRYKALDLMCMLYDEGGSAANLPLLEAVYPYLFPLYYEDVEYLQCIFRSKLVAHPLFKGLKEECYSLVADIKQGRKEKLVSLNTKILETLANSLRTSDISLKTTLFSFFTNIVKAADYEITLLFGTVFISESIISSVNDANEKLSLFSALLSSFEIMFCSTIVSETVCDSDSDLRCIMLVCIKDLKKNRFPISAVAFSLRKIMNTLPLQIDVPERKWWPDITEKHFTPSDHSFVVCMELFTFLLEHVNSPSQKHSSCFRTLMGIFLKQFLPSVRNLLWFLSYIWSNLLSLKISVVLQESVLKLASTFCVDSKGSYNWFFHRTPIEFLALLVPLSSDNETVRFAALQFLEHVVNCSDDDSLPYRMLACSLIEHKEEIMLNSNQLTQCFEMWLFPVLECSTSEQTAQLQVFEDLQVHIHSEDTPTVILHIFLLLLQKADSPEILQKLLPVLKRYFDLYNSGDKLTHLKADSLQLMMKKFSPSSAMTFVENGEEFKFFTSLLQTVVICDGKVDRTVQKWSLEVLTKEFFVTIPSISVQQSLLDMVVSMYIDAEFSDINEVVEKTLKRLCSCAYLLLKELPQETVTVSTDASLRDAKRTRLQNRNSDFSDISEKGTWKKIIVILEIIQNKSKIKYKEALVAELFRLLHSTLQWEKQSSVEYVRQLILSCIFNCMNLLGIGGLEESKFQVELIIQCIRATSDPKTHHQSLLLLNLAAKMFPDRVLSNIMSIFTFMGSSLVRQDDSYSFQVISQTIETIVPALQQASQQKHEDVSQVMAAVTRMFVDSIADIPRHRQLPLFTKLINTLGPSEYLWIPLGQICERYAYPSMFCDIYNNRLKAEEIPQTLELAITLHEHFPISVQLQTCLNLINHLTSLPDKIIKNQKPDIANDKQNEPFDIMTHDNEQLQAYKCNILSYMNLWLSSSVFLGQVLEMESKVGYNIELQYETLLQSTLNYLQHASNLFASSRKNTSVDSNLMNLLYDLLHNVNSLLPCKMFIKVVKKLLANRVIDVQQKAIEILNEKLQNQPRFFTEAHSKNLMKLLKALLKILNKEVCAELDHTVPKEQMELNQTALLSIHLIAKTVGGEYPMKLHKVLPIIIDILCNRKQQYKLVINALLCLAELCRCLNALVLPHLNMFMPEFIKLMEEDIVLENEYLGLGILVALKGLVLNLGAFLSSYMDSILLNICVLSNKHVGNTFKDKIESVCELISSEIASRVLLPSIQRVTKKLLEEKSSVISPLVAILNKRIAKTEYTELEEFIPMLHDLFLFLLDIRNHSSTVNETLLETETNIVNCLFTLVMKLSEPTFRTLYSDIYKWAVPSTLEEDKEPKDELHHKNRILTFYRLTHILAKNLKSLFVPCAKKILRHSASLLNENHLSKIDTPYFGSGDDNRDKSILLLHYIIDAFNECFLYSDGQMDDKDCFEILMQPLVDQITNQLGGDDEFQDHIENHVSHCISNFIVMFSDSARWKSLNYQVLLQTRHSLPKVRFASLKVTREIVKKMSDNYLVLLPEAIPFLAEIMEDESVEVEQECQDVLIEMEKILGEPIKKYF